MVSTRTLASAEKALEIAREVAPYRNGDLSLHLNAVDELGGRCDLSPPILFRAHGAARKKYLRAAIDRDLQNRRARGEQRALTEYERSVAADVVEVSVRIFLSIPLVGKATALSMS